MPYAALLNSVSLEIPGLLGNTVTSHHGRLSHPALYSPCKHIPLLGLVYMQTLVIYALLIHNMNFFFLKTYAFPV